MTPTTNGSTPSEKDQVSTKTGQLHNGTITSSFGSSKSESSNEAYSTLLRIRHELTTLSAVPNPQNPISSPTAERTSLQGLLNAAMYSSTIACWPSRSEQSSLLGGYAFTSGSDINVATIVDSDQPGFEISLDDHACNEIAARFDFSEVDCSADKSLRSMEVGLERTCDAHQIR